MSVINELLDDVPLPRIASVGMRLECPALSDPIGKLKYQLESSEALRRLSHGATVAIGAGSRGICMLPEITREVVRAVKRAGGIPFIFPAMGSHGGATAEGQKAVLDKMGLTDAFMEAPVKSSMETVEIGRTKDNIPVYQDKIAHDADWIVPVNRIKPHTTFRGKYESGLVKMLIIGMGKQKGANTCHCLGSEHIGRNLENMLDVVQGEGRTLMGVAVLENAKHGIAELHVVDGRDIRDVEPSLLDKSASLIQKIPIDPLDVLVIYELGKDISGTGVDTNIIGRYTIPDLRGDAHIKRITALNLTEKTGGNANGVGLMDFISRKLFERISFEETYPNSITTTIPASVKIPMTLDNDLIAIQAALKTCGRLNPSEARFMMIRNTMDLSRLVLSENLLEEALRNPNLKFERFIGWNFNENGDLVQVYF
jgi:hypothetical protein